MKTTKIESNPVRNDKSRSTIQAISKEMFSSSLLFLNARSLNEIYGTRNKLSEKLIAFHLESYFNTKSSAAEWTWNEDKSSFGNLILNINVPKVTIQKNLLCICTKFIIKLCHRLIKSLNRKFDISLSIHRSHKTR